MTTETETNAEVLIGNDRFILSTAPIRGGQPRPCAMHLRKSPRSIHGERFVGNYWFQTEEERERWLEQFRQRTKAAAVRAERRRRERAAAAETFDIHQHWAVGDLLSYSWGYDQTNVDHYKVTKVSPRSIVIQPIGSRSVRATGWASDMVVPDPDTILPDPPLRKVVDPRHPDYVAMDHGIARKCRPDSATHRSWYA